MPRIPISRKEKMDRQVRACIKSTLELKGLKAEGMAKCMGISRSAYYNKFNFPESITLKELRILADFCDFSNEEIYRMVREEKV